MIIPSPESKLIQSDYDFEQLTNQIRQTILLDRTDLDTYYEIANAFNLPLHISFLIIHLLKKQKPLQLYDLASVSFYAICRDILTTYKNKAFSFKKWFKLRYPYLRNTDERLEWFLKHNNGLSLTQKIGILEADTSINAMGIGRIRFERALMRLNINITHEKVEQKRLEEYDGSWPAAIASFVLKERGDCTTLEVLRIGDALSEETSSKIKIQVFSSLLAKMGKIEVFFLASQINRFHDNISRTSSLVRAFAKTFNIDIKMLERLVSMHSMVDVASLVEQKKNLDQFEKLIPFRPFKPMLAVKWEKQYNFPAFAEAKYDGVRLLIHKLGNRISGYARRRKEYTSKFSMITQLASYIPAYSIILDGEITGQQWTVEGPRYLNVYELHEVIKHGLSNIIPIYVIFDVLFLNGVELLNLPYNQRKKIRHQVFEIIDTAIKSSHRPPEIQIREVETVEVHNSEQLIHAYNSFINTKHEGAIIKDPEGLYELGKRSHFWIKLKPKETLDVTITGIVPIQHQGALRVWGIRYAVRKEEGFQNIGRIYGLEVEAGIKLADLILANGLLPSDAKVVDLAEDIPSKSRFTRSKKTLGFEIDPFIVITIDSLGIVRSDDKFSLRNARFLHIREDMDVEDISEWREVYINYMRSNT